MKENEIALLMSNEKSYLVEVKKEKLHTKDGIFDLSELFKKKFGDEITTQLNKKFVIVKPNILDVIKKRVKRLPQIITPKDIAMIFAYTGISQGSLIVDAGCGSGYLAIFLANYIKPGKVVTYENDKRFIKVAKQNIELSGLSEFIKLKPKDITKGIDEKGVDLVTLDMKDVKKVIKHAYRALKSGGYLVVYSPYVEQVKDVANEIKRKDFFDMRIIENIVREWQVEKYVRPKTMGLMHTGFLTIARKMI